jgi:hypothetical protein
MAISDDKCEECGQSILDGAEPQRITATAVAGVGMSDMQSVDDMGMCSDACREAYCMRTSMAVMTEPLSGP